SFHPKPFARRVWMELAISHAPARIKSHANTGAVARAATAGISTARNPKTMSSTPQAICHPRLGRSDVGIDVVAVVEVLMTSPQDCYAVSNSPAAVQRRS